MDLQVTGGFNPPTFLDNVEITNTTLDGSEILHHRLDGAKTRRKYWDKLPTSTGVSAGFLNHQQYVDTPLTSVDTQRLGQGRFFVALSLEEAEHLRGALQGNLRGGLFHRRLREIPQKSPLE